MKKTTYTCDICGKKVEPKAGLLPPDHSYGRDDKTCMAFDVTVEKGNRDQGCVTSLYVCDKCLVKLGWKDIFVRNNPKEASKRLKRVVHEIFREVIKAIESNEESADAKR